MTATPPALLSLCIEIYARLANATESVTSKRGLAGSAFRGRRRNSKNRIDLLNHGSHQPGRSSARTLILCIIQVTPGDIRAHGGTVRFTPEAQRRKGNIPRHPPRPSPSCASSSSAEGIHDAPAAREIAAQIPGTGIRQGRRETAARAVTVFPGRKQRYFPLNLSSHSVSTIAGCSEEIS